MRVSGPTLHLRLPRPGDDVALYALGQDPEVVRWFSWGPYTSIEQPRAYLAEQERRREDGVQLDLLVCDAADAVAGVIGLSDRGVRDRRAIIGTWLGRAWWGTGANAEAKALMFALAFGPLGLQRLGAYCDPANTRSARALEKVGFVREGLLRGWHRHGDEQKDVLLYGLLRAEWEAMAPVAATVTGEVSPAWRPS